jgi:hypothetical protein
MTSVYKGMFTYESITPLIGKVGPFYHRCELLRDIGTMNRGSKYEHIFFHNLNSTKGKLSICCGNEEEPFFVTNSAFLQRKV